MLVTLSERKLSARIRELEGLDPATSTEEITDRLQFYSNRLFEHLRRDYGVSCLGMVQNMGAMATFQFELKPCYDEQTRIDRITGLSMMDANSVSVEQADLPALVPNRIMQSFLSDEWSLIAPQLQRILPSEIPELLEQLAGRAMRQPGENFGNADTNEEYIQLMFQRAGLKDPLAKWQARDEAEQRELQQIEAQRQANLDAFINGER